MKKQIIKRLKWIILLALCGLLSISYSQWVVTWLPGDFTEVFFLDEDTGFIAGYSYVGYDARGIILRTSNGGTSWDTCLKDYSYTNWNFKFLNNDTGYVIGWHTKYPNSDTCGLYKTIDAGNSWNEIYTTTDTMRDVYFINNDTGYVVGGGSYNIYQSLDGGVSWSGKLKVSDLQYLSRIDFPTVDTGYAIGNGAGKTESIYRTIDRGNSWVSLGAIYAYDLVDMHFFNGHEGIIIGKNDTTYTSIALYTSNAGASFTLQNTLFPYSKINAFDFSSLSSGKGLVYATDGYQLLTSYQNGSATTPLSFAKENIKDFYANNVCIKGKTAYAVGYTGYFGKNTNLSIDSVWPGDANYDNIANVDDVLNVGVAYADQGPIRTGASASWVGQACDDWTNSFSNSVNHKHADCDGNGIIDSLDIIPIYSNYGLSHYKTFMVGATSASNPDLYIESSVDTTGISTVFTAKIKLGTSSLPVSNVYGFALSINYNSLLIDSGSLKVNFNNSWVASKPGYVSLVKDFYNSGQIDIGFSKIDQIASSGYGEIGELSCIITDNIDGKDMIYKTLHFDFLNAKIIDPTENNLEFNAFGDSVVVSQIATSGINSVKQDANQLLIYPSPFTNIFTVSSGNGLIIYDVIIFDAIGQMVYHEPLKLSANKYLCSPKIPSGIYFIRAKTNTGFVVKKIRKL